MAVVDVGGDGISILGSSSGETGTALSSSKGGSSCCVSAFDFDADDKGILAAACRERMNKRGALVAAIKGNRQVMLRCCSSTRCHMLLDDLKEEEEE